MDNYMGEEGVQHWKEILIPNKHWDVVVDLGSGITMPYKQMLSSKLSPKTLWFVDDRFEHDENEFFEVGENMYAVNQDAFDFLESFVDGSIDFLWASEFLEHIPPPLQKELVELVKKKARNYIFTFPTIKHHDFHNDWTHRPVMLQHLSFLLYGETAWEGMITNISPIKNRVMELYKNYKFVYKPRKMVSRARLEKLGENAYD